MSSAWFWRSAGPIVLGNFVLIWVVLSALNQGDVLPMATSPDNGATDVSTRPVVRVSFQRPMDLASLRDRVRLDPPAPGQIEVTGNELEYTPGRPLAPSTRYALVLPAGIREQSGRTARQDVRLTFTTRAPRLVVQRGEQGGRSIWLVDPTAHGAAVTERRLTDPSEDVALLAPAPDGDELAYVAHVGDDHWALRAVRLADGHTRTILGDQRGLVTQVRWSPRGDLLAYELSDVFGTTVSQPRIWLARADGSQTALIYGRGAESGSMPVWSPDGAKVAFYENQQHVVALFNFTGSLLTLRSDLAMPATWSPGGDALAYVDRGPDNSPQTVIKIARTADPTAEPRTITDLSSSAAEPAWSPAGDWIAFIRRSGTTHSVWLTGPDGANSHPVFDEPGWIYTMPTWSPDGRLLAFTRLRLLVAADELPEVWVAPLDGPILQLGNGRVVAWLL